jgi:hypothetical protein
LKTSIYQTYSREELEGKLRVWLITEFGSPNDFHDQAAKDQWYRDFGLMYHFICDTFPAANNQIRGDVGIRAPQPE